MKNYFISVLVSNYNKQKFLNKSLKSLTFQKYKNFEIIFYDDASTDNSLNIVKNFKKIQIIKNLKQKSHSAPLNQINSIYHAFEKSKGEIICLMDADDLFSLNKLKIVNNFFITNKKKIFYLIFQSYHLVYLNIRKNLILIQFGLQFFLPVVFL